MSGEIERRSDWTDIWEPTKDIAKVMASTVWAGAFRQDPAGAAGAILYGNAVGLDPIQSMMAINVIQGRPDLSAEAARGLYFTRGHKLEVLEWTDRVCKVRAERGDGRSVATVEFTLHDAELQGLLKNANYRKDPKAMLFARASKRAIRAVAPEVLYGMEDEPPQASGTTTVQIPEPPAPGTGAVVSQSPPDETQAVEVEPEVVEAERVTDAQLRKINAQIRELERRGLRRLDKDQRRQMIAAAAGIPADVTLATAKDLTKEQGSTVIEALQDIIAQQEGEA